MWKIVFTVIVATAMTFGVASAQEPMWVEVPGIANDVGVGANGTVWIVGSEKRGNLAFRWDGNNWVKAPMDSWMRIAVAPDGSAYAVNRQNKIYRWRDRQWQEMPSSASDIGVGADGSVFIVGTDNRIYKWVNGAWEDFPGSNYLRVSVDDGGNPYVVDQGNKVHRWANNQWQEMPGNAVDIGVGPGGSVFIVDTNGNAHQWSDGSWKKLPDGGYHMISVGPDGEAWAIKSAHGRIFRLRK